MIVRDWPTYPKRPFASIDDFRQRLGGPPFVSDWITVDQPLFDGFAASTGDDAFVHTDPEGAARTRFKGTIAHGLLTLSLLPFLLKSAIPNLDRAIMGVNYGYDRVRFIQPVPCDASVRGKFSLAEIEDRPDDFLIFHFDVEVEIKGQSTPALAARWLLGRWIKRIDV